MPRYLLLSTLFAPALVLAQSNGELRSGFMQCGETQITARAECFEKTAYCLTETLSFARRSARSIVLLHRSFAAQEIGGKRLKVLEGPAPVRRRAYREDLGAAIWSLS